MKNNQKKIALFQEDAQKKILSKLCKKGYQTTSLISQREALLLIDSLCEKGVISEQLFNEIWEHYFLPDKEHTGGLRESSAQQKTRKPTIKQVSEALKDTHMVLINRLITIRNEVFTLDERLNRNKKKMDFKLSNELTAEIDQKRSLIRQCEEDLEQLTNPFQLEFRLFVNSQLLEVINKKGQKQKQKQKKNEISIQGESALKDEEASDKSRVSDPEESFSSQIPKVVKNELNVMQEENQEQEHRQKHYRAVVYIAFMLSFIEVLSIFTKCHFLDLLCIFLFTMNCLAEDYLLFDQKKPSEFSLATKVFLDVANNRLLQRDKFELQGAIGVQNQNKGGLKHDFQNFIISGLYLLVLSFAVELLWLLFEGQALLRSGSRDFSNLNLNLPFHINYNQATAYISIVSLICKVIAIILLIRIQHVSLRLLINRQVIYLPVLHFINIRKVMERQLKEEETPNIDLI